MLDKKAELAPQWFYWSIFIFITVIFVGIVRFMPAIYFVTAINTYELENKIYNERVFQEVSVIDNITLRQNYGVVDEINDRKFDDVFSKDFEKKLAFKIIINENTAFFNKDFYDYARPLAPVRYKIFHSKKSIILSNNVGNISIEQVFTHTLKPEDE